MQTPRRSRPSQETRCSATRTNTAAGPAAAARSRPPAVPLEPSPIGPLPPMTARPQELRCCTPAIPRARPRHLQPQNAFEGSLLVPEGASAAKPSGVRGVSVAAVDLVHAVEEGIAVGGGIGPEEALERLGVGLGKELEHLLGTPSGSAPRRAKPPRPRAPPSTPHEPGP
eukprot:CAMPEP_0174918072 /NCGR_PEP_ID=MMETSP1355-20121228/2868_1 /TAXON_ID=464990 /ORGANISM="Hemiselmis tepida, Strain CCMP443" /LENGTH=169 /DNA_ID=CAMNT_0016163229 /DNA_START=143 /DNA_END=648 /DNA_ORIENTATION=+